MLTYRVLPQTIEQAELYLLTENPPAFVLPLLCTNTTNNFQLLTLQLKEQETLARLLDDNPTILSNISFWLNLLHELTACAENCHSIGLSFELNLLHVHTIKLIFYQAKLQQIQIPCLPVRFEHLTLPSSYLQFTSLIDLLLKKVETNSASLQRSWHSLLRAWLASIKLNSFGKAKQLLTKFENKHCAKATKVPQTKKKVTKEKHHQNSTKQLIKSSKKIAKTSLLSSIKKQLKAQDLPFEKTQSLELDEMSYRIALISEGPPGTSREQEGLRSFILVDDFLIGRDRFVCDLPILDPCISRKHARITRYGGNYFIEDLGSCNATYVDGKKLNKHREYILPDNCKIQFAQKQFFFKLD